MSNASAFSHSATTMLSGNPSTGEFVHEEVDAGPGVYPQLVGLVRLLLLDVYFEGAETGTASTGRLTRDEQDAWCAAAARGGVEKLAGPSAYMPARSVSLDRRGVQPEGTAPA